MKKILLILGVLSISMYKSQLYTPNNPIGSTTNVSTNNVGIGTNTPTEKLEIFNSITTPAVISLKSIRNDAQNTEVGKIVAKQDVTEVTNISFLRGLYSYSGQLTFSTRETNTSSLLERMRISPNGNVGIGTSNPQYKLEVNGSIAGSIGSGSYLKLYDNHATRQNQIWIYSNDSGSIINSTYTTGGNASLIFQTANTEKMRISPYGNVGIGTSNPQYKLEVIGDISSNNLNNEGGTLTLLNSTKTGSKSIRWSLYNMTGNYGDGLQFWSYSADGLNRGSRLTISDSGNVGIGTSSPTSKLEVAGTSSFSGNMKVNAKIEAKEVKVTTTPTADFVFAEEYKLPKLEEVEKHIKEKKHLPEIASAKEMEKEGVNIGEFQIKLLQKIEELTLYSIEQNKQLKAQNEKVLELEKQVQELKEKTNQ